MWLPSPNKPKVVLKICYGDVYTECIGGTYNHRLEKRKNNKKVKCEKIFASYPFVQRPSCNKSNCVERLVLNGEVKTEIVFN
jgi:hypothetical protein